MPRPVARIGDVCVGICYCHKRPRPMVGHIISGNPKHLDQNHNPPLSRIGDIVLGACGHTGVIITGNFKAIDLGSPYAHIGDIFTGCFCGVIITGDYKNLDGM